MRQVHLSPGRRESIRRPVPPVCRLQATRGDFPARAISARSSAGLLVILAIPSRRPSSVIRTSTAAPVQVHADDLPAVIRCLHWGLPITWWETDACNFQHPPGSGRLRSFIASRVCPAQRGRATRALDSDFSR